MVAFLAGHFALIRMELAGGGATRKAVPRILGEETAPMPAGHGGGSQRAVASFDARFTGVMRARGGFGRRNRFENAAYSDSHYEQR